jgi:hypothetical protein
MYNIFDDFNLFDYHYRAKDDILLSYKGPFSQNVLNILGTYIKVILAKNPKQSQKIYRILFELAQNVAFYSAQRNRLDEDGDGIGSLVILEKSDAYYFVTGNSVFKRDQIHLLDKCEKINSLDPQGLRAYKRKQLELPDGEKGGANIGLIQVAITAANPLNFASEPIDDQTDFFSVAVKVSK